MRVFVMVMVAFIFSVTTAFAASPKTYQVTGPVLEMKEDTIVVQKGKEKWEIAKDATTKATGDLKVGSKVTIEYTMKAVKIDVKEAAKKNGKEAPKKPESTKEPAKK